jgi:hypothetical protein
MTNFASHVKVMDNIARRLQMLGDLLARLSGWVKAKKDVAGILTEYRAFHESLRRAYEDSRELLAQLEQQQGQRSAPQR